VQLLLDDCHDTFNNRTKRSINPFIICHKNCLLSNSPKAVKAGMMQETAKLNDINPFPYLEYLFEKLPNINIASKEEVMKLMPWSKDIPASCRNLSNQETSTCTS